MHADSITGAPRPAMTRRALLGHSFGAIAATALVTTASAGTSPELARLIDAHDEAMAAYEHAGTVYGAACAAHYQDRIDPALLAEKNRTEDAMNALLGVENVAFCAVLAHPCRDLAELRTVLDHAQRAWWSECEPSEREIDAFFGGIMGKAA